MRRRQKPPPKLCCVQDCGKPHRAHGLCMGHYLRYRSGKSLAGPLSINNKKLVNTGDTAVNARVSLEARAVLTALADAAEVSLYQYTSELLEKHADERKHAIDYAAHLKLLMERKTAKKLTAESLTADATEAVLS